MDPNGDTISSVEPQAPSGGTLDKDNSCFDFVLGRPENISWPQGQAPTGSYKVQVFYYEACSGTASTVDYTVTSVVDGQTTTYNGTISAPGDTVMVTTFNVP